MVLNIFSKIGVYRMVLRVVAMTGPETTSAPLNCCYLATRFIKYAYRCKITFIALSVQKAMADFLN